MKNTTSTMEQENGAEQMAALKVVRGVVRFRQPEQACAHAQRKQDVDVQRAR